MKILKSIFNPFILLSVFLIQFCELFSQLVEFETELSSKKINVSIFDSKDLFWIATEEGLDMYDGNNIHNFQSILSEKNSLLNSSIQNIIEINNKLLFVSKDGLSIFNREKYNYDRVKIPLPISIVDDKINDLVYVTTSNNGLYQLDYDFNILNNYKTDPLNPFTISSNSFFESSRQKTIKFLNQQTGDIILAADQIINLFERGNNSFKRFSSQSEFGSETINSISIFDNNNIIVARRRGLEILNIDEKKFKTIDRFKFEEVYDVYVKKVEIFSDDEFDVSETNNQGGEIVAFNAFVLSNSGLFKLSFGNDYNLIRSDLLSKNNLNEFDKISTSDKHFFIWGSNKNRVVKFNYQGNLVENYSNQYPMNGLCIDKNENIIISSINGLFVTKNFENVFLKEKPLLGHLEFSDRRYHFYKSINKNDFMYVDQKTITSHIDGKKKTIQLNSFLDEESISYLNNLSSNGRNVAYSENGNLSILTNSELVNINLDTNIVYRFTLPNIGLFDGLDSVNELLYLSHSDGILTFDFVTKEFKDYRYDELFNINFPRGFSDIEFVGSDLWISNIETGLHVFNQNIDSEPVIFSIDTINTKRITSKSINKITYGVENNKALISTQGDGLFVYNLKDSIFTQLKSEDGLLSNNIKDADFGSNFIYVLSSKGINYFEDLKSFKYEIDITNGFDVLVFNNDGLRVNTFEDENLIDSDDEGFGFENETLVEEIEIIGSKKIISFQTDQIALDDTKYEISILNAKVFENSNDFVYSGIDTKGIIDLSSDVDFIEIELFSNNKYKRNQVEYFYSLNSSEKGFISNGFNNIIRLQSLPNYESDLKIKSINKSGIESNNVIELKLFKSPPWYQRIETIVAYVLFALIGVYFYSRWREKSASKKLEEERRNKELEEARELQNSLLPKSIPHRKEYDISVYLKSATEVGGDYYDFIESEDEELFVVCGDATGHGVVSGIMVSVTKAGLNGIEMSNPGSILNHLNSIVKRVNFGRLRMSLSVAKINNGSVELSSAAMPPTYYYNANLNKVEEILVPNLPLGGIEGEEFEGVKKDFKKGDVMVMISDGLPELPNRDNVLLDYPKVFDCIKNNCNKDAEKIKDALVDMSENWSDGLMNPDDITIVVIKKAS